MIKKKICLLCLVLTILVSATFLFGCSKESADEPLPNHGKDENWTPKVEIEQQSYVGDADGGTLEVRMKANGKLTAELYPLDGNWARIESVSCNKKQDEYTVTVSIDKNEGLGRITSLYLHVDGASYGIGPCIIQKPAEFDESIEMSIKPGMLQVLLGDDMDNLSKIRHLKISGGINILDLPVIEKICHQKADHPVEIDISDCGIKYNEANPYEYYGWTPNLPSEQEVFLYEEIPTGVFTNSQNLVAITLPSGLKYIARRAFEGCTALKRIAIPDTVEEIRYRAFYGCCNMEDIEISEHSNLVVLEGFAFGTKSQIHSLRLPITLTDISQEALADCYFSELHVSWQEPPVLYMLHKNRDWTLYVPIGTAEIYKNTKNWFWSSRIVEEEVLNTSI